MAESRHRVLTDGEETLKTGSFDEAWEHYFKGAEANVFTTDIVWFEDRLVKGEVSNTKVHGRAVHGVVHTRMPRRPRGSVKKESAK